MSAAGPAVDVVMCTLGTRGDLKPFLAIGRGLVARGHRVTMLSNENWRDLCLERGLDFLPIAPADPSQSGRDDHRFFVENVAPSFKRSFALIGEIARTGRRPVVVYKAQMSGAEYAAAAFGLPGLRVALQPSVVRSAARPPWPLNGVARGRLGQVGTRALTPAVYALAGYISRSRPHMEDFRRHVREATGYKPRPLSPRDATLVLCPEWFAMPQADWPWNCRAAGFPHEEEAPAIDPQLAAFVRRHGPPLVFTPGTGVSDAAAFFAAAERVCAAIGAPGLFLSPSAPACSGLAPVLTRSYLDLRSVLPQARALVHHGGIGTTAAAICAGAPQVVLPGRFDQPDNAMRVAELGIGAVVFDTLADARHMTQAVKAVLTSPAVRRRVAWASEAASRQNGAAVVASTVNRLIPAS